MSNTVKGNVAREKLLTEIIKYIETHGYPPSYTEMMETTGIKSKSTIYYYIRQMIENGELETDHENSPRALRIPGYQFIKIDNN